MGDIEEMKTELASLKRKLADKNKAESNKLLKVVNENKISDLVEVTVKIAKYRNKKGNTSTVVIKDSVVFWIGEKMFEKLTN